VGLEFYDHYVFPKKYRGAYFMADWSLGIIHAVHLERDGASYKAKVEKFCQGAPMNVTDLNVGPDGALYFVMGGRGSQGGVYRIVYTGTQDSPDFSKMSTVEQILRSPQPLSAWGRAKQEALLDSLKTKEKPHGVLAALLQMRDLAADAKADPQLRMRAIDLVVLRHQLPAEVAMLKLSKSPNADLRAHAMMIKGITVIGEALAPWVLDIEDGLSDTDALVRRRTCEAYVRIGHEPPIDKLWPLLGDEDRFVRHAARLLLERIDPRKWTDKVWEERDPTIAFNGIIALCHTNQAEPYTEKIFARLRGTIDAKVKDPQRLLDWLRTTQLAMVHCSARPIWTKAIAKHCEKLFPHKDWRVNRELAILLVAFQREGHLDSPIQPRLLKAVADSKKDRLQQIHYVYCMRLLKDGWTPETVQAVANWYEGTRSWTGGHSFVPFLENIFRDCAAGFSVADRKAILNNAEMTPLSALQVLKRLQLDRQGDLLPDLKNLQLRLSNSKGVAMQNELRQAVDDAITQTVIYNPTADTLHLTIAGVASKNPVLRFDALMALRKATSLKPKADDPVPFRTVIGAVPTFGNDKDSWEAIQLLRQWTGRGFGVEKPALWKQEHQQWALWFNQTFPKEPPLKTTITLPQTGSKHKFEEVLAYLDKERGDPVKGKVVFDKANCIKCHKYGKAGEGVGPDLTTVSKRFKRADILDSIIYPSKVISDQYRSVKITTKSGQEITGLAAVQGDTVTVLLSDASKVTLRTEDIDTQVASLISVMPERLLDPFTFAEIADLFAFMESDPK
jgi:putative heme-binding domain-containing protein